MDSRTKEERLRRRREREGASRAAEAADERNEGRGEAHKIITWKSAAEHERQAAETAEQRDASWREWEQLIRIDIHFNSHHRHPLQSVSSLHFN